MSVNEAGSFGCRGQVVYYLYIYSQLVINEGQVLCRVIVIKDSIIFDVIQDVIISLRLDGFKRYVLVEVKETGGEEWVLDVNDSFVYRVLLWLRRAQDEYSQEDGYYFLLQERNADGIIKYVYMQLVVQVTVIRRLVERGFLLRQQADFDDLCNFFELTEANFLKNFKYRFLQQKIYTYAGSIFVVVNFFKFFFIYNFKYVKMYENQQLGKLESYVFALVDVVYYVMFRKRVNQCIVIFGESGFGKVQSINFLIYCFIALSQKGYVSGVERIILGVGFVLEVSGFYCVVFIIVQVQRGCCCGEGSFLYSWFFRNRRFCELYGIIREVRGLVGQRWEQGKRRQEFVIVFIGRIGGGKVSRFQIGQFA